MNDSLSELSRHIGRRNKGFSFHVAWSKVRKFFNPEDDSTIPKMLGRLLARELQPKGNWKQAAWIVKFWPKIVQQIERLAAFQSVRVTDNGNVERLP